MPKPPRPAIAPDDAHAIRGIYMGDPTITLREVGARYGVSFGLIHDIVHAYGIYGRGAYALTDAERGRLRAATLRSGNLRRKRQVANGV